MLHVVLSWKGFMDKEVTYHYPKQSLLEYEMEKDCHSYAAGELSISD